MHLVLTKIIICKKVYKKVCKNWKLRFANITVV